MPDFYLTSPARDPTINGMGLRIFRHDRRVLRAAFIALALCATLAWPRAAAAFDTPSYGEQKQAAAKDSIESYCADVSNFDFTLNLDCQENQKMARDAVGQIMSEQFTETQLGNNQLRNKGMLKCMDRFFMPKYETYDYVKLYSCLYTVSQAEDADDISSTVLGPEPSPEDDDDKTDSPPVDLKSLKRY